MNYQRIYEYRFRDIDQDVRRQVWEEISAFLYRELGSPERVLDPAAGRCEFINAIPAVERWAVDVVEHSAAHAQPGVRFVVSEIMNADLPRDHFDAILASNFLEHLPSQGAVAAFLERMHGLLRDGGRMAIIGPNFKYCADEYFDCADHTVVLSHLAVAEHLYAAGFEVERIVPRFLPYSFRGRVPAGRMLARRYLGFPPAWRLLGKQFLVVGRAQAGG